MQRKMAIIVLSIMLWGQIFGQTIYPKDYFASPVKVKLGLAGNFGEIRPNHFHAGFDIRTNGKEGMPVYAAADGYISRIKVSAYGYGKALYITHANGYITVYGHLQSYNSAIGEIAKKVQYEKEAFEIDTLLTANMLPVKKGDLIGLSGNTGGSEAPHLHFEIRDAKTEMPINPYCFGYAVPDNVKPVVTQLAVYPIGETASINGKHILKKIKPTGTNGKYFLNKSDTIHVNGDIGFGIECYDSENGSTGQNQVFSIELQSGGKRIYYYELEKFSFDNGRYVNAHIDYVEKQKNKNKIQKCFLSKNNQVGIYKDVVNTGVISFTDDSVHWIKFIVKDFVGNTSEVMMKVRSSSKSKIKAENQNRNTIFFDCSKENEYKKEGVQVSIPAYSLYDDIKFTCYKTPATKGLFSEISCIQNKETALQKAYTLSIKPSGLTNSLQSKAVIISFGDKGKQNYEGGILKDDWVITQTKIFGNFAVTVDTTAPSIKPNFNCVDKNNVDLSKIKTVGFTVKDNISGVKHYRATIDGKWVLLEYEFKKDLLFYTFDSSITSGKHVFNIDVEDDKQNVNHLTFTFKK